MRTYITDYLERNARKIGDQMALVTDERVFSWHELFEEVEKRAGYIAKNLEGEGQQVVATLMPNGWELVVTYLGIIHAGHIAMPIDVIFKPLEINAVIEQIKPVVLITDEAGKNRINSDVRTWLFSDTSSDQRPKEWLRIGPKKQVATLVFTSGTTGKPKAAPHTHDSHIWNIEVCSEAWGWDSTDSMLLNLNLSHWYGLCMGLSGVIYHGNTCYLRPRFSAKDTLGMLASGKITMYTHVSMAYIEMMKEQGKYDLSSVKYCISGGAALPPAVWNDFKERFGIEIIESYGSSETGRIASNLFDERIPGSPGRPLRDVQITFSEEGEVLIKSPGLFPGYWKNPEATRAALVDGWWHTGDLGELQNGRIVLKGRIFERIRKQGYHISPRDVEWALYKNPAIKEAIVVGIQQDDSPSDKLVYFIVGDISETELQDFCKQNLPSVWRPDEVVFLEEIPKTRGGKAKLPQLKEMVN